MPFLNRGRVAERYGVNKRTIVRWEGDPKLDFPKPEYINGRCYHDEKKLDEADARRALQPQSPRAFGKPIAASASAQTVPA
jgi:hypothetical protein